MYNRKAVEEKIVDVLRDKLDVSKEKAERVATAIILEISDWECDSQGPFWFAAWAHHEE